jgi:hypothetical protein
MTEQNCQQVWMPNVSVVLWQKGSAYSGNPLACPTQSNRECRNQESRQCWVFDCKGVVHQFSLPGQTVDQKFYVHGLERLRTDSRCGQKCSLTSGSSTMTTRAKEFMAKKWSQARNIQHTLPISFHVSTRKSHLKGPRFETVNGRLRWSL